MKKALITGSTKGIGKQIGKDLLTEDCFVYFNYAHNNKEAEILDDELRFELLTSNFGIIKSDLSKIKNVTKLANKINKLDYLILNLGITDRTPFGKITYKKWTNVFNTNLTNSFFLIQALKNKINDNGKIIFISSISGCITDSTSIAYGASKGAINMLVPYLAKEFAEKKITVNAIAPGYIATNWHRDKPKAQIKRIEKKCLANRLGTTQEVSKAVLSVIDNDFINAQIIRIDGGFLV